MQVRKFKEALDKVDPAAFGRFVTVFYTQLPHESFEATAAAYSTPAGLVDRISWADDNFDYWSGIHATLIADKGVKHE